MKSNAIEIVDRFPGAVQRPSRCSADPGSRLRRWLTRAPDQQRITPPTKLCFAAVALRSIRGTKQHFARTSMNTNPESI
jgi:hypothetical protein